MHSFSRSLVSNAPRVRSAEQGDVDLVGADDRDVDLRWGVPCEELRVDNLRHGPVLLGRRQRVQSLVSTNGFYTTGDESAIENDKTRPIYNVTC